MLDVVHLLLCLLALVLDRGDARLQRRYLLLERADAERRGLVVRR
jgi:hypothetical protein